MEIRPRDNDCGAEIDGVDLQSMSDEEVEAIADAQAAYGVVFLRGQTLTPDHQLAAARRFGPINVNRFFTPVPGHPQVALVLKEPRHEHNVGGGWHTDHSYDEAPALGSMLFALEVPSAGGDTLFASMYKAYEALSPGLRRTLAGLSAVHSSRHVFGKSAAYAKQDDDRYHNAEKATQDAVHPVVIRHPRTGRAALYVNPAFTVRIAGWTDDESRPLLEHLYGVAAREDHTVAGSADGVPPIHDRLRTITRSQSCAQSQWSGVGEELPDQAVKLHAIDRYRYPCIRRMGTTILFR